MNRLLIASTASQSGKSVLADALAAYWQTHCQSADSSDVALEQFTPITAEHGWLDLTRTWQALMQLEQRTVLIKMPGSLGTPMTPETTVADLAWDWRLPTVLVVPVTPDPVAQAVAHVALARQARVHLKGIVVNHTTPKAIEDQAIALIQSLTQVPVLGQLAHLPDPQDTSALVAAAAALDLERLFPLTQLVAS